MTVPPVSVKAHGGAAHTGIRWSASPVITNGREPRQCRALLPDYHTSAALDDKIMLNFNANKLLTIWQTRDLIESPFVFHWQLP
jgi:hypothetical protein